MTEHFEKLGYTVLQEYHIESDGAVDLLAERQGERIAIEVETGKSNIKANLTKVRDAGFDRLVFVGTSPAAVGACHRAIEAEGMEKDPSVNLMSWLDVG